MVGLPCARGSNQPQRRGRSGCGCCIRWNPNKTRMKCGLHSRKTIFEHPPLSEQEILSAFMWDFLCQLRSPGRSTYICLHHVCACSCHDLPILNDVKGSPSMAKVPTPHMPWFCWVTKQCNRGYRLQIILGTDRFIRPKNLKGALYSRDACTFSNQPWMISRYFKGIKALWARKFDKDDYSLKVIFLRFFEFKSFETNLVVEENKL